MRKIIYSKKNTNKYLDEHFTDNYQFHHKFWKDYNKRFLQEKKKFLEDNGMPATPMEVQNQLSRFYKEFLDKNLKANMEYDRESRRRNLKLLWTSLVPTFIHRYFTRRRKCK